MENNSDEPKNNKAVVNSGPKITIGGYVNAILQHHFEVYKDEIEDFHNNSIHKPLSL